MSKDHLEDFVRKNRAQFDQELPSPDLWARIESDLGQSEKKKVIPWGRYLLRAASIILVAGAAWMVNDLLDKPEQVVIAAGDAAAAVESPEVRELLEAEVYYASQFDDRIRLVEQVLSDQPQILEELRAEFLHLDSVYAGLREELNQNIETEQVIMAMMENHRIKAGILNEILNQIKREGNEDEKTYNF